MLTRLVWRHTVPTLIASLLLLVVFARFGGGYVYVDAQERNEYLRDPQLKEAWVMAGLMARPLDAHRCFC